MPTSRVSVAAVGQTLLFLLMSMLLLLEAQNIPHYHSNLVRENELGTFENSHILVKEQESDVYLYKELSWIGAQQHRLSKSQQLAQFTSTKRETIRVSAGRGTYVITVTSLHVDSHVKIFVSANPELAEAVYPRVPANNSVSVLANRKTLVLEWPSAAALNRYRRSMEYCVTISRIKNFHSHCGALAHFRGDKKPVFATWGFSNEKDRHDELRRLANPVRRAPRTMIFYQCVANKTSFTFTKAGRGKTYYADVFVVDRDTQMASSYTGANVKIKYRKLSPITKMKVGETKTINLKRKKAVELTINSTLTRLAFEVVPCSGNIHFQLYFNGHKNRTKTLARQWKRHFVRHAQPGTYLMAFPGQKKRKKTFVTVFITSSPSRSKIVVPRKRKIKVFGKLTTCSNMTLAWMGSSVEQNYCLYKRRLQRNGHDSKRRRCLSPMERPEAEREMCTTHSATDSTRQTISYNVTGLQRDTWYRFDVYVRRGRSIPVPYKSVKVKTLAQCLD